MNQMISHMVDILFQDVAESEETRALHDELMINCQEHYQDLIASGMPEDEAAAAVMDSLSGMQEVVDQYPRRDPEAAPAFSSDTAASEEVSSAPEIQESATRAVYASEGVQKIRVDAGAFDVEIAGSAEQQIVLRCEHMERLSVLQEDGVFSIRVISAADQFADDVKKAAESEAPGRSVMDMTLNELLKKAKSFVDTAWKSVSEHVSVSFHDAGSAIRLTVPASLFPVLEVNTGSGNVHISKAPAPEYTLRSASGDITLSCSIKEAIDRVFTSSASGDIHVSSAWVKEAEISTISGDLDLEGDYGSLSCKSVSGDVDFEGTAVTLNSKSVSGDVDLTLVQGSPVRISAEATSGDVSINLPQDCAEAHLDLVSTAGDVWSAVEDAGASAPLTIRARTISGDVEINRG